MRPKCISSHPDDIDVFFYKPKNKPAGYSLLHPAVRKLAFAHDHEYGCLDVEDMPKQFKNVSQPVGYPVEARKVFEMLNDH